MNRILMIGAITALMFTCGCKRGSSLPERPKPIEAVQIIQIPSDLGDAPRDMQWSSLVEFFNATVSGLNSVAANVGQLGDKATDQIKSALSESEASLRELRGKIEAARQSGSLDALNKEITAAGAKLDEVRQMLVP